MSSYPKHPGLWAYVPLLVLALLGITASTSSAQSDSTSDFADGKTLAELGVTTPILLSADTPTRTFEGLEIPADLTDPSAEQSLVFEATMMFKVLDVPDARQVDESQLSFSLNKRAMVQMRVVATGGTATVHGTGWVDSNPRVLLQPGVATRVQFVNYAQYTSSDAEADELTMKLDLSDAMASRLEVTILPESRFVVDVNPSRIVELEIKEIDVESSPGQASIDYEVRSQKADFAEISLESPVGLANELVNYDHNGNQTTALALQEGRASGTAVVELRDGSSIARGTLVAITDWNSPAETFSIAATDTSRRVNWPFAALACVMLVGLIVLRFKPWGTDTEPS